MAKNKNLNIPLLLALKRSGGGKAIALKIGCAESTVSRDVNGTQKVPRERARAYSKVLRCRIMDLFTEEQLRPRKRRW